MKISSGLLAIGVLLTASCQNATQKETTAAPAATAITPVDSAIKSYDIALVDNKKDPACGMPLSAGIADTAHYQGKVLGFCSSECKESFKKDPVSMLAAAEMKK